MDETWRQTIDYLAREIGKDSEGSRIVFEWGNHQIDCGNKEVRYALSLMAQEYLRLRQLEKQ